VAVGACLLLGSALLAACGSGTPTARPSASLVTLDFTPLPTTELPSVAPTRTPRASSVTGSWPVGWDVAFCTAFADTTVAHELVIDIERAIADDSKSDAQGLANELAQTTPIASGEVTKLNDWEPATDAKAVLTSLLDLDTQAATAYQSYFNDDVKSELRHARQLRNQVKKQVGDANDALQALTAQGLSCPGTDLTLEEF
jgi:hypothetical protein